ncbi:hypothetical protein OXR01_09675 [Staphylococcus gallinarum]|jgi:hypothetical protein|uniref:Uncharacterized protein n=1 Tax=Staphylococcus gallinarum TaxID=1293 RepID=A0A3A0TG20_STAGA|nr:hypothetical protein [Staphylococcus gallinarum]MBU7216518.1 hypothetical protein [Staphylococcus gallinarum]MCD8785823.1 hypothetical protein [Staphylococcus gallinarum]MCD8793624.1 hypothetical protein [Staphylococcus gallinarum]MCD8826297.1 hypothetical protein [Staphylococcus gallinarum]MCD8829136.1 hypothetical protein [Staphylococcus gallinarum]
MQLLNYKMHNDELVATVLSDKKQLFKYSFDVTTPEYEILEVLEEINEHVDNGQHPLGCSLLKTFTYEDVSRHHALS